MDREALITLLQRMCWKTGQIEEVVKVNRT